MVALASIFVPVQPTFGNFGRDMTTGLRAGFNAAEAEAAVSGAKVGRRYGQKVAEEGGKTMKAGLEVSARQSAKLIGEAFAIEKGVDFLRDSVKAASDLYETSSKLNVLFGSSGANSIEAWAQDGAKAFGLSRQAAEDAAGQFGVFAKSAGLSGGASVDFAEKLTGLTGDLTSFYNPAGGVAQATEAVGAALRGESEPIRQFGVLLDDATLRNRALQMGLISTTKNALTPQQRVLAAYQEILHQTGAAQGDFARTSDSFANRQRNLANQFEDTKVAVGQALLPVMTQLMDLIQHVGLPVINGLATGFARIPQPVYASAIAVAGVVAAVRSGQKAFEAVSAATKTVGEVMRWMGLRAGEAAVAETVQTGAAERSAVANDVAAASASRLGTALGTIAGKATLAAGVAGLALVADEGFKWAGNADVAKTSTDQLASSLLDLAQSGKSSGAVFDLANINSMRAWAQNLDVGTETMQRFADEAAGAFSMSFTDIIGRAQSGSERLERFNATAAQLDAAFAQLVSGGHIDEAVKLYTQFIQATGLQGDELQHVINRFPQYAAAIAASNQASAKAVTQGRDEGQALREVATAAGVATAATKTHSAAQAAHGTTLKALLDRYPNYRDTVLKAAGATSAAKAEDVKLTAAQAKQIVSTVNLKANVDALSDSLDANKNRTLALRGGESAWYAALDEVRGALNKGKRGLDLHTASGRANDSMLRGLASSGLGYLSNIQNNIGVGAKFKKTLDVQWHALYDAALRFTGSRKEAKKYADEIYAVPKALATKVTQPGMAKARADTQGLARDLGSIKSKTISVRVNSDGSFTEVWRTASGGIRSTTKRREGGGIHGGIPGAGDTVPAMLSHGEHVWTSREVSAAGGHGAVSQLRQAALSGTLAGFAAGGPVLARNWVMNLSDRLPKGLSAGFDAGLAGVANALGNGVSRAIGSSGGPVPGGSGVARWGPMVHRALAALGLAQSLWDNWMRQIQTESGGNERAVQGAIGDINNRTGDLAQGLVQVIGATFRAYHVPGTSWSRFDPWANLLAGMNYARHRYGSRMEGVIGHGHGYDAGGWLLPGQYGVNTSSRPERVLDGQQSEAWVRGQRGGGGNVRVVVMLDGSVIDDRVHVIVEDAVGELGARLDNGLGG